jgi:TupA-like ATPgrasp
MTQPLTPGLAITRPTPDSWPTPEAKAGLWSSLVRALRETRWSSLAVASNMVGQLGVMFIIGKWPLRPAHANSMRGVDFYPWQDFLHAVIRAARRFKSENGYLPLLARPASFNEHLFARKFFAPLPLPSLADKLAAKEFVRARLGNEFLPAAAWVGDEVGELFAATLPQGRYVLKANHGCNWNMFLNLPEDLSAKRTEIEQTATSWLNSRYGYDWGEWQYSIFKPKLFLEEFIDFNGVQTPDDYKLLCFHGKVRLIEVDVDRSTALRSAFYTPDWTYIPVTYGEEPIQRARPRNLDDMIRVAEAIAAGMEFVRIDLYTDGNSRMKFGEITFTPGDASLHFSDFKLDLWLGAQFVRGRGNSMPWGF